MMYLISIPGRIVFGWLADRVDMRRLYAGAFVCMGLGLVVLENATAYSQVVLFALVYGPALGCTVVVQSVVLAQFFGTRHFATLRGMSQPISVASGIAGPVFAGLLFDKTGTCQLG